jgi:hypothetical protein
MEGLLTDGVLLMIEISGGVISLTVDAGLEM